MIRVPIGERYHERDNNDNNTSKNNKGMGIFLEVTLIYQREWIEYHEGKPSIHKSPLLVLDSSLAFIFLTKYSYLPCALNQQNFSSAFQRVESIERGRSSHGLREQQHAPRGSRERRHSYAQPLRILDLFREVKLKTWRSAHPHYSTQKIAKRVKN